MLIPMLPGQDGPRTVREGPDLVPGPASRICAVFRQVVALSHTTVHFIDVRNPGSLRGSVLAVRHILRTQGFRALYRGHSLSLARAVPHAAVGFTAYEHARAVGPVTWIKRVKLNEPMQILMPTPAQNTPARRFVAGAIAGLAALPVTYPFELVRVRMATDAFASRLPDGNRVTPFSAIRSIWSSVGSSHAPSSPTPSTAPPPTNPSPSIRPPPPTSTLSHLAPFYRGFPITVLGSVPYRGGIFLTWETLHAYAATYLSPTTYASHRTKLDFSIGAMSGALAQAATYPLEIVRRRQQVAQREKGERGGVVEVVKHVYRSKGWRGFYVGMGLGLVKQVPMHAISLGTWQLSKRALGIA